jgi:hypothetical protein
MELDPVEQPHADDAKPLLLFAPKEVRAHILANLNLKDVPNAIAACTTLANDADAHFWNLVAQRRYGNHVEPHTPVGHKSTQPYALVQRRRRISLHNLDEATATLRSSPLPSESSSAAIRSGAQPIAMQTPLRYTGVQLADFSATVDAVCAALSTRDSLDTMTRPYYFADAIDWMGSRCAKANPVGALAVLLALRSFRADLHVQVPATTAVTVRTFSFNEKRDLRGFRGQDEMSELEVDVRQLAEAPGHPTLAMLQRAISMQDHAVRLVVLRAAT